MLKMLHRKSFCVSFAACAVGILRVRSSPGLWASRSIVVEPGFPRRVRRPELADFLHDVAGKDDTDDSAELVQEIQAALEELRPDYRAVFIMFHEQGSPYEVIAVAMDRPVGTIKTWLHRARLAVLRDSTAGWFPKVNHPCI